MMIEYRKAEVDDIEELVKLRIEFLKEVDGDILYMDGRVAYLINLKNLKM